MQRLRGTLAVARLALRTRSPLAFLTRQRRRAAGVFPYHLRGSGVTVHLRHGTPDVNTYEEVFLQRQYEPPGLVRAALARLDAAPRVADLGANVGLFGAWTLAHIPRARLLAFEPDPANAEVLRRTIAANAADWELVEACAGVEDGSAAFVGGGYSLSRLAAPGEDAAAATVPVVDALERLRDADVLKIDVEGGEWALLADPRFAELPARVVVLEYHPHLCPDGDARTAALGRLEALGFEVAPFAHRPDGTGMVWAWRS